MGGNQSYKCSIVVLVCVIATVYYFVGSRRTKSEVQLSRTSTLSAVRAPLGGASKIRQAIQSKVPSLQREEPVRTKTLPPQRLPMTTTLPKLALAAANGPVGQLPRAAEAPDPRLALTTKVSNVQLPMATKAPDARLTLTTKVAIQLPIAAKAADSQLPAEKAASNPEPAGVEQRENSNVATNNVARQYPVATDTSSYYGYYGEMLPHWLRDCVTLILDLGSGSGLTVKQLIHPQKYPGSLLKRIYTEKFGNLVEKFSIGGNFFSNHVCVLGFEPDPKHVYELTRIEKEFTAQGFMVHFVRSAVWNKNDQVTFYADPNSLPDGAKRVEGMFKPLSSTGTYTTSSVKAIRLASFITDIIRVKTIPFIKMDIEGSEYSVLLDLLDQGLLCYQHIQHILVKFHEAKDEPYYDLKFENHNTSAEIKRRLKAQTCIPTVLVDFDDNVVQPVFPVGNLGPKGLTGDLRKKQQQPVLDQRQWNTNQGGVNTDNRSVKTNYGAVGSNNPGVNTNGRNMDSTYWKVNANNGQMIPNFGQVNKNNGQFRPNYGQGNINGQRSPNNGQVNTNQRQVVSNYGQGNTNGQMSPTYGQVNTNQKQVVSNYENVNTNNRRVGSNYEIGNRYDRRQDSNYGKTNDARIYPNEEAANVNVGNIARRDQLPPRQTSNLGRPAVRQ